MITLIGGIEVEGVLRRDVMLKPLTGAVELMLAELGQADLAQPDKVTRFLAETVASVGGVAVAPEELSVGDRQYLVRQIGVHLGVDLVWLSGECSNCGEVLEIPVRQGELPVKPAGAGFPAVEINIAGTRAALRAPTGKDQAAIAALDGDAAVSALFDRLVSVPAGVALTPAEREALEQAIEDLSPEVAQEALAACPECQADLRIEVDPYLTLSQSGREIFDEIHQLASHYHWAESAIVALPKARRETYLALIDRDRGMMRQFDPGMMG